MTSLKPHITSKCFVNAPFERLKNDLLQLFCDNRIQPEVGLEGDILYTHSLKDFEKVAEKIEVTGLSCTLHAPFLDLCPGATDHVILAATRDKLKKAFELIPVFQPRSIVCHLDFDKYKHKMRYQKWFNNSMKTWENLLAIAERYKTVVMFENTFETDPEAHKHILESLDSSYARFCLDVGHVQAFARNSWQDWLPAMDSWLGQLHLHDNNGKWDEHLAIGKGTIDFRGLFNHLEKNKMHPIITLEPHQEIDLWDSLKALDDLGIFNRKV